MSSSPPPNVRGDVFDVLYPKPAVPPPALSPNSWRKLAEHEARNFLVGADGKTERAWTDQREIFSGQQLEHGEFWAWHDPNDLIPVKEVKRRDCSPQQCCLLLLWLLVVAAVFLTLILLTEKHGGGGGGDSEVATISPTPAPTVVPEGCAVYQRQRESMCDFEGCGVTSRYTLPDYWNATECTVSVATLSLAVSGDFEGAEDERVNLEIDGDAFSSAAGVCTTGTECEAENGASSYANLRVPGYETCAAFSAVDVASYFREDGEMTVVTRGVSNEKCASFFKVQVRVDFCCIAPTSEPTASPTLVPTLVPTFAPTLFMPTSEPTLRPTDTFAPTAQPTSPPTTALRRRRR